MIIVICLTHGFYPNFVTKPLLRPTRVLQHVVHCLTQRFLADATDQNMLDWPPRSPDITPLDSFLWAYVKDDVFTLPFPETVEQMKVKIQDAIKKISRALLEKVHESFRRKLKLVIEKKGSHIENHYT